MPEKSDDCDPWPVGGVTPAFGNKKGKMEGVPVVDGPVPGEAVVAALDELVVEATPLGCDATPAGGDGATEAGVDVVADDGVDAAGV